MTAVNFCNKATCASTLNKFLKQAFSGKKKKNVIDVSAIVTHNAHAQWIGYVKTCTYIYTDAESGFSVVSCITFTSL